MKIIRGLLLLLVAGCGHVVNAQDIHYSMFDLAPLSLNPAHTGNFEGTFRVGGIYRSQWLGLSTTTGFNSGNFSGYQTPSAYIDAPLPSPFRSKKKAEHDQWFGVGLYFLQDKVGKGQLTNLNAMLSLSYHIKFGAEGNTKLSIGARGGLIQQRVDASKFEFEDGIVQGWNSVTNNYSYIPVGDNNINTDNVSLVDFSAGFLLSHNAERWGMELGFSANHLGRPKYQFLGSEAKLPLGLVGSAIFNVALTERLFLRPQAFYQNMSKAQELNVQALLGWYTNESKDLALLFGGGYRFGDAAILRIGAEWKRQLRFGFAYDLNASGLSNNSRAMGFEVGLSYIAKLYKEPVVKPILFCPRF